MRALVLLTAGVVGATCVVFTVSAAPSGEVTALPLQDRQQPQQEITLTLSNPGSHPVIAVPDFASAEASLGDTARTIAEVLWADLDYEREFTMVSRKAAASIPAARTAAELPFTQWAQLGADFVLMGSVRTNGASLTVEVHLISVKGASQGQDAKGQSYQGCTKENPRYCAHSIADDIHKTLRGLDGVARTRIAFSSDRDPARAEMRPVQDSGQSKEIYIMDYDGANVRKMTVTKSLSIAPSWGPDGRSLAYASYATQYPDVYVATFDGRPVSRPAHGTEMIHNQNPAFSPDGMKIAYTSNRAGQTGSYDIWVVNRDGSDAHNITPNTPTWSEGASTWSPNGNQIAFTSDRTGTNQIYIMNADGTGVNKMTSDQQADRPTWSKLNFIAYTLKQPAGHDVAVLDLSRGGVKVITDGRGSNRQPTVAPNGRHIIFVTTRWGKEQLASVDRDGQNIRQLTNVGNNTYPSWSPSPR